MKNLIVFYDKDVNLDTKLEEIPKPTIQDHEVLVKVHSASLNPKDWKHPHPTYFNITVNQGDDVAGTISAIGSSVRNFRPGDRVAGFHVMDTERGAYAEYCVCPEWTVFHLPHTMAFEEGCTIPLAAYTAAVGLFRNLGLPMPFERSDSEAGLEKVPLVINAAGGAVGAFAVKLAKLNSRISPIIGVASAGKSADYASRIGCDFVVDRRSPDVAGEILKALGGKKMKHVFDAANSMESVKYILPIMAESGARYTMTAGGETLDAQIAALKGANVWYERIWVGSIHEDKVPGSKIFGAVISRVFEWELADGRLKGHPYTVVGGGLQGVKDALIQLRDRKSGNEKFVARIADTN
jgi:NADPH:quinone reductase